MIQGIHKTSLIDYPGHIASTVFFSGCSMYCPFCHNPGLVKGSHPKLSEDKLIHSLALRRRYIDAVCITGGEPTIHPSLPEFISRIKSLGFRVKLDTNGTNPGMLKGLIKEGLVDYIAMDIKSSPERYHEACGCKVDMDKIKESVEIIKNSGTDYEFRTTAVPVFFGMDELKSICLWLRGSKRYFIQQFENNNEMLEPAMEGTQRFSSQEINGFIEYARQFFTVCEVRNT